jgi:indole-3-glycerol phosphate synthase
MSNILETIVNHKKQEVSVKKGKAPVKELEASPEFSRPCFSLAASLKDKNKTGIIAEFKRCSPSKGMINEQAKPEEVTGKYTKYGAAGLSVLTDEYFFKGQNEDLKKTRYNNIPILRKDFIIDEYQVIEAKSIGADVILLIAECLEKEGIKRLAKLTRELGMEVLLEMHSESQLDKISPDVTLVGINNRDLKTFTVDIDRSIQLSEKLPEGMMKIAESGIDHPETIIKMKQAGFDGFLMGEYFMKQQDPGEAFREFVEKIER